ncbi:hypothetical protein CMV_030819, partial [Castanea mollissima]
MNSHIIFLRSTFLVSLFLTTLVAIEYFPVSLSASAASYSNCIVGFWRTAKPDACGNPRLRLTCEKNVTNNTTVDVRNVSYRLYSMSTIVREDFATGICSPTLVNVTLHSQSSDNVTLSEICSVCTRAMGVCSYHLSSNDITCYCSNHSHTCLSPPSAQPSNLPVPPLVALAPRVLHPFAEGPHVFAAIP